MNNAKELIAFLAYWAKEMAPDRKDVQSVTFTIGEMKAVLREASERTEAYQEYLANHLEDTAPSGADTSAAELISYAEFNEELLRIGEVFDPPSIVSFSLEQIESLRQEILLEAETYHGFRSWNMTDKGGIHEPS